MNNIALDGVKILELCTMVAGPYCTKLMADLGAEVIKIEKTGSGDEARKRGPFLNDIPHPEKSLLFLNLNTNKLGITLDLGNRKGRWILRELVKDADILVEDNSPGAMSEMGLGYDALKKLNPKLIMVSITPFGQTGPYRYYRAHPLNMFHASGEGYLTPAGDPYPDRPPLNIDNYVGEYAIGIYGAFAAASALYWQRATGEGQYIDISRQEALMSISALDVSQYPTTGEIPLRIHRGHIVGGIMPCKDGWVELSIYSESNWQGLVELFGNPDWAHYERFKEAPSRAENAKELNQLIIESLMKMDKNDIYHRGQKLGIPAGIYFTAEDVFNSKQEKSRGFFHQLDHSQAGRLDYPTAPYKFSETPWQANRAAPLLGEHNEGIYHRRLGYTKQELVRLRGLGVI
ncbi:CaiB/BaiF CoA transferase family protein [Chloroflexota bacterium]